MELQPLGGGVKIYVSEMHRYGTDALLLADFAAAVKFDTACDLGTGCGIIPLVWLSRGYRGRVYGVDIMPEAAELCRLSAEHNRFEDNFYPVNADLRDISALPGRPGSFDLVTMNPPYKRAGAGAPAKSGAARAARAESLCTPEDIVSAARYMLKNGGRLCMCSRPERLADIICAMRAGGMEPKRLRFAAQHSGCEPSLFLIEGKKAGRPGLRVLPTLHIEADGGWSEEMKRIYGDFA